MTANAPPSSKSLFLVFVFNPFHGAVGLTSLCFFFIYAHWDSRKALEDTKKKACGFLEINVYIPTKVKRLLSQRLGGKVDDSLWYTFSFWGTELYVL